MLHSYQVLSMIQMQRRHELERWQLERAARAARPRGASRRGSWLRALLPGSLWRRPRPVRRPTVDGASCC
jgi:hypothetical protein